MFVRARKRPRNSWGNDPERGSAFFNAEDAEGDSLPDFRIIKGAWEIPPGFGDAAALRRFVARRLADSCAGLHWFAIESGGGPPHSRTLARVLLRPFQKQNPGF